MNPNALKQLAIVVKQGSISRACEQLFVTQPTLTRSIQLLEARVGAPVLKRTRYGVTPTEIGARLALIGERILADTDHAEEVIRQYHSGYQSEFSIGIDPLWEFATVNSMTHALMREKQFVFHLRTGSAAAQIGLLKNGDLDFLLAPAHLSVAQSDLHSEVLFRDRTGVFAGRESALIARTERVKTTELEAHRWIIAGASAGFLDEHNPMRPQAAQMAFTGSILSVLHLLKTSDALVRLPARLTLMTAQVGFDQMLSLDKPAGARRDIALWYRSSDTDRPDFNKVAKILRQWVLSLDEATPLYGLEL